MSEDSQDRPTGEFLAATGAALLRAGSRLADRYEIVGELGRGGMGVVYRARDPELSREVAVKLITPSLLGPETEARFRREAQVVAQMDHSGVVPIFDFGRHEGSLFFVMPLLAGTTLRRLVRERSLTLGELLDVGAQVAEALDYSHARGVVHRDVKPENVMVAREGGTPRARVMDFGLATAETHSRLTQRGALVGTLAYLSPEQVSSQEVDGRTDVYALGTVLYECLVGEPPFSGEIHMLVYRIVHELPRPPRSLGADVSEEIEATVLRCLEKDPQRRPQTAGELAELLKSCRTRLDEGALRRSSVGSGGRLRLGRAPASAFVGREKEFAALQRRLNAARAGECQIALVGGETGAGKTRLAEELEKVAQAAGVRVLRARVAEEDQAFVYQGFYELIHDYFSGREQEVGERPDFSDLAPDLLALFPVLGELGEFRSAAGQASVAPTPRRPEDRTYIFELLARTVARMGTGRPTLLVLENLHGAEVSLDALHYVVRRLGHSPLMVVGTYRTTEVDRGHALTRFTTAFAGDPRFALIVLGSLSVSEAGRLVESLVGGPKLAGGLVAQIHQATEGNPLFTKEVVRSLLESGGLAQDESGAWMMSAEAALSAEVLPTTVQEVVAQRVERLPEEVRVVLSVASVLGRSFAYADLEALTGASDLERVVERLVQAALLEEESGARGDRLAFVSEIVREALYRGFSARRRRGLHRRYAEHLERRHAGRLERAYPQLLHHFAQGDVPEKTVHYGLLQAKACLMALSPDDAVKALRTALECLRDETWSPEPGVEGEARKLLASAQRLAGNLEAAFREAEAAVRAFEKQGLAAPAAAAMLLAAEVAWQRRRVEDARRWLELGIERARPRRRSRRCRVCSRWRPPSRTCGASTSGPASTSPRPSGARRPPWVLSPRRNCRAAAGSSWP